MSHPSAIQDAPAAPDQGKGDQAAPMVGMVANVLTPYWVHLFLRFAREIPGIRIATCTLFEHGDQPWSVDEVREIRATCAGPGEGLNRTGIRAQIDDWRKAGRVIQWIKDNQVKVVVIGGYADLCRAAVIRWCHRNGIPVLIFADSNVRSRRPTGFRGVVKLWFFKAMHRMVRGVLVCGRNGADYFSSYGFPHDRIFICPVEPDYRLIQELTESEIEPVLRKYGLNPERKRAVACSRLVDIKRVDMAIDAFTAVAHQRPDWDLVVIGSGPLLESLKSRVPSHLRDRVVFTGFIGNQREISAIYRGSHVLVHAAEYEPFGLVICEATAAGMAMVVSSIVGAAAEVVGEGSSGRFFPVGNLRLMTFALLDATDERRNAAYRANSRVLLNDWRHRGDPVIGLSQALRACGLDVADPSAAPAADLGQPIRLSPVPQG